MLLAVFSTSFRILMAPRSSVLLTSIKIVEQHSYNFLITLCDMEYRSVYMKSEGEIGCLQQAPSSEESLK